MAETAAMVLIVARDRAWSDAVSTSLARAGYAVLQRFESYDGLIIVEEQRPAVVILDWQMPFIDGLTFVVALQRGMRNPPPVIAVAGAATPRPDVAGIAAWLTASPRPVDLPRLVGDILHAAPAPDAEQHAAMPANDEPPAGP